MLVQKKDGRFYLMLWQVIPIYKVDAQTDINHPAVPITVEDLSLPLAPAPPTFGDERAIGARLQPATDKMLIAPEAKA